MSKSSARNARRKTSRVALVDYAVSGGNLRSYTLTCAKCLTRSSLTATNAEESFSTVGMSNTSQMYATVINDTNAMHQIVHRKTSPSKLWRP